MNKAFLIGRLTRDPDVRTSESSEPVKYARFTLAVNRRRKKDGEQDQADFISCVAFGKNAEFAEKYLAKGKKIALVGRIQTGSYTNRDGNKVYTTEVIADEMEFAESLKQGGNGGNSHQETQSQKDARPDDGFVNVPDGVDDELPFS